MGFDDYIMGFEGEDAYDEEVELDKYAALFGDDTGAERARKKKSQKAESQKPEGANVYHDSLDLKKNAEKEKATHNKAKTAGYSGPNLTPAQQKLRDIAKRATEAGMSYGKYVAFMEAKERRDEEERRRRERTELDKKMRVLQEKCEQMASSGKGEQQDAPAEKKATEVPAEVPVCRFRATWSTKYNRSVLKGNVVPRLKHLLEVHCCTCYIRVVDVTIFDSKVSLLAEVDWQENLYNAVSQSMERVKEGVGRELMNEFAELFSMRPNVWGSQTFITFDGEPVKMTATPIREEAAKGPLEILQNLA